MRRWVFMRFLALGRLFNANFHARKGSDKLFYADLCGLGLPEVDVFEALDLGEVLEALIGHLRAIQIQCVQVAEAGERFQPGVADLRLAEVESHQAWELANALQSGIGDDGAAEVEGHHILLEWQDALDLGVITL
jgi:hypothetical protein